MSNGIEKHIVIEIPRTLVPAWKAVDLPLEPKGLLRLTRRARQLLGLRRGAVLRLVPVRDTAIFIVVASGQKDPLSELR